MKRGILLGKLAACLLAASIFLVSCEPGSGIYRGDLAHTLSRDNQLSMTVQAIKASGLEQTLAQCGPFTVFAPTSQAWQNLPDNQAQELLRPENKGCLASIVAGHIVKGKWSLQDLHEGTRLTSLEGSMLIIGCSNGRPSVNRAVVISGDVNSYNGVVHTIDRVILPPGQLQGQ